MQPLLLFDFYYYCLDFGNECGNKGDFVFVRHERGMETDTSMWYRMAVLRPPST